MDISILPKFLQVELTYACNSSCSFCYNPTHNGKIDRDKLKSVLEEVNSCELRHVQLIGGEVTILKELPEYLRILDRVGRRSIVTNGRKFRPDIKGLVDEIYISLHGNEITHEILTSEKGSYAVIEENIKKYAEWGIDINSDTVLTKYNAGEVFLIAEKAKSIGMSRLFLNIFQPEGIGSARPDFSPSISQIRDAITQMIRARDELDFEMNFGTSTPLCLDERLVRERLAFRCGAGEWFGSISPTGEFRICNHSTKSYGNVSEKPLNKIWHLREIDDSYRNKNIDGSICHGCPALELCRGGCRINQKGGYRTDPIVTRDLEHLLTRDQLDQVVADFHASPYKISYA